MDSVFKSLMLGVHTGDGVFPTSPHRVAAVYVFIQTQSQKLHHVFMYKLQFHHATLIIIMTKK